jgi:hypothetical protein
MKVRATGAVTWSRERISVGVTGFHVEGTIATTVVLLIIGALVLGAFATGKASAILDACFGLR